MCNARLYSLRTPACHTCLLLCHVCSPPLPTATYTPAMNAICHAWHMPVKIVPPRYTGGNQITAFKVDSTLNLFHRNKASLKTIKGQSTYFSIRFAISLTAYIQRYETPGTRLDEDNLDDGYLQPEIIPGNVDLSKPSKAVNKTPRVRNKHIYENEQVTSIHSSRVCTARGGVCLLSGVCLLREGVCLLGRREFYLTYGIVGKQTPVDRQLRKHYLPSGR